MDSIYTVFYFTMNLEVNQVISRVEQVLQRNFITSSSFQEIKDGQPNNKGIFIIFLIQFFRLLIILQSSISAFVDDKSPWRFYVLNYYISFGIFGRVLSGIYICAFGLGFVHSIALVFLETKAKLVLLTDLRDMFSRLLKNSRTTVPDFSFTKRLSSVKLFW